MAVFFFTGEESVIFQFTFLPSTAPALCFPFFLFAFCILSDTNFVIVKITECDKSGKKRNVVKFATANVKPSVLTWIK